MFVFLNFTVIIFVSLGHSRELLLNGHYIFGGFVLLALDKINLMIETVHEIVVDELVLCEGLIFLEVFSQPFFFLVRKYLEFSKFNLKLLLNF